MAIFEKRTSKSDKVFDVVVAVSLLIIGIVSFYPLLIVVSASLSDPDFVNRGEVLFLPKGFQLTSYELVFRDDRIITGYINSFIYMILGTILSVMVTIMAAYPLSRKDMLGHAWITWFFLIPMYISGGLIPTFIQVRDIGLLNNPSVMVILGCLSIWNLIVCRTYFQSNIPIELWEAASIDGCSVYKFFFKMVIPNSKAIIAIMVLYYAVGQWNEYFRAMIYLNDSEFFPLQLFLRDILLASQSVSVDADPEIYALMTKQAEAMKYSMIVISSLPVLVLYPFIQKYFVKGVMIGSVKG